MNLGWSPVCAVSWKSCWSFCVNLFSQKRHLWGFSPVCILSWASLYGLVVKRFSQKPHLNGLSPVCILSWRTHLALFMNSFSQKLHLYLNPFCCPVPIVKSPWFFLRMQKWKRKVDSLWNVLPQCSHMCNFSFETLSSELDLIFTNWDCFWDGASGISDDVSSKSVTFISSCLSFGSVSPSSVFVAVSLWFKILRSICSDFWHLSANL